MQQHTLTIATRGRQTIEITDQVDKLVGESGVATGLCNVFVHHTSASLMLCENADPTVRHDLETFFARLTPDGDPMFSHTTEGPDDMPAHVRTMLTQSSLTMPVTRGRLALGTWQGIYLWEHRQHAHQRHLTATIFP